MGRPSRPSRCLGPIILRASSMSFQRRSIRRVSIAPGEIVLARMPCAAWSAASTFASWIKAPLVAQYAGLPGEATRPSCEAMRITLPPPRVIIAGIAAFAIRKAPVRLIQITRSQAASSISSTVAALSLSAAPYIRTSRPPKRCTVSATAPRQLAPSVTSRCTGSAWPPPASTSAAVVFTPGSSTSAHATLAPAAAKASAVARPIPFAAPTTMATFFSSVNPESIITSSMRARALPPALGPAPQCTIARTYPAGRSNAMLPTHGRYDYSNITKRPDYAWPGGRRLAVYVALNIEAFSFGAGKGAAIAPPDQAQRHSVFSWRDYGNRVGIWRLFELLDDLGIPAEAQMNTAIYEMAPDIPERLRARGDEILGHGVTNSDEQGHLGEDQERALIESVTATIARHEGAPPVGWMSPWLSNSAVTMDLLQEAGYRYAMDWTMDDQPIWIRTRKGRILAMPYPIEVNDTRGIVWYHYTADEFADLIVDQFDEMLEQSARQPLVCPISLHPFVTGRPYRIRRLRHALQHILGRPDRVWLTRPRDICAHVEALPAGVVPGSR